MKKQIAWIFGGAAVVGLGMVASLDACSSGGGGNDAGKDVTTDTNKNDVATQDVANDTAPPQDAGPDCKTVPSKWPFPGDGSTGPFCPYQQAADGGTLFSDCQSGEHCCIPAGTSNPSTCQSGACTFTTDASTNADFQCEDFSNCGSGEVCCENAGAEIQQDLGCTSYDFVKLQHGSSCVQGSCSAGQAQLCASDAECGTGKTCFPLNTKGVWMGVCLSSDGGI